MTTKNKRLPRFGALLLAVLLLFGAAIPARAAALTQTDRDTAKKIEELLANDDYDTAGALILELGKDKLAQLDYTGEWLIALYNQGGALMEKDEDEAAVKVWEMAGELGSSNSALQLAILYAMGSTAVEKDSQRARELLHEVLPNNEKWDDLVFPGDFLRMVGFLRLSADDAAIAREFFFIGAELGDPVSQYELGYNLNREGETGEDHAYLEKAAEQDYAPAIYALALETEFSEPEEAAKMFEAAADALYGIEETNDPETALTIGFCYENADGKFKEDRVKAKEWYLLAGELREPLGYYYAGSLIWNEYVDGEYDEMMEYWTKAANMGCAEALYALAVEVLLGEADMSLSGEELMKMAAERGSQEAQMYLDHNVLFVNGGMFVMG